MVMMMMATLFRAVRGVELEAQVVVQPAGKHRGKVLAGKGGAQVAGQGNGHLDGGQEGGGILHHAQQFPGNFVAFLLHFSQLGGV